MNNKDWLEARYTDEQPEKEMPAALWIAVGIVCLSGIAIAMVGGIGSVLLAGCLLAKA